MMSPKLKTGRISRIKRLYVNRNSKIIRDQKELQGTRQKPFPHRNLKNIVEQPPRWLRKCKIAATDQVSVAKMRLLI